MNSETLPPWQQERVMLHSQRLLRSFQYWTATPLLSVVGSTVEIAQALFEAPFVVVSHGTEADPVLNYGNRMALRLWEMDWQQLTSIPSRYTAEPMERSQRERLLAQAKQQGYINDYRGIRISSTGKRFWIENVVIWDVLDEENRCCGQAASFSQWQFIE